MDYTLNLVRLPKEVTFILELLKDKNNKYLLEHQEELCRGIDWKLFMELAIHHRVFPLLYSKIKIIDKGLVPSYVLQFLSVQYRKNTFKMLHLSAEMEKVSKLFSKHEIQTLFLKGPVLAEHLYGDISMRTSSDIDFLIPIENLEKAEALLRDLGYEKDDYIQSVLNDWRWRHHHVTYFHPNKKMKLEIHWRLHPGPGKEPSFDDLWARKRKSTLTNFPVYLLGREDLFLFLVCHGARHGWSRLRWLVDIQMLMNQNVEWGKLSTLFKTYDNLFIGGQAIILVSQLLNRKIKKEMIPLLAGSRPKKLAQDSLFYIETMVNLHTDPIPKEVSSYHSRHLFSLMSSQQKIVFILSFLHPFPEDAQTLPLPKKLHFLYFPLRPFLWAWRKTRKHALP